MGCEAWILVREAWTLDHQSSPSTSSCVYRCRVSLSQRNEAQAWKTCACTLYCTTVSQTMFPSFHFPPHDMTELPSDSFILFSVYSAWSHAWYHTAGGIIVMSIHHRLLVTGLYAARRLKSVSAIMCWYRSSKHLHDSKKILFQWFLHISLILLRWFSYTSACLYFSLCCFQTTT